ncbi:MAG: flavodoxin domain-containing protein, partial [Paludibacteraceae bacterium]|nr:flavodoxin domain-containing protein [Paludibacteraceae bacterium]
MKKTIVVYGSSTGTCEGIANEIASKLGTEAISASKLSADIVAENENLILGTSTWGSGEIQDDWYDGLKALKGSNLNGKTVAIFGCGDSSSYSDTFCGGMAEIYNT